MRSPDGRAGAFLFADPDSNEVRNADSHAAAHGLLPNSGTDAGMELDTDMDSNHSASRYTDAGLVTESHGGPANRCAYCAYLRAAGKLQVADYLSLPPARAVVPDAAVDEHPNPSEHVTRRDDHG